MRKMWKRVLAAAMAAVLAAGGITCSPGTQRTARAAVVTDTSDYYEEVSPARVSVHDPSIIKDPETERYYIFGSHMAWAWSDDLETWTTFTNNINTKYATLFKKEIEWAKAGDSVYDASGNLWAPDVIWNKKLRKWCMYMSINGCSWNSAICMLTADSLDGDWTVVDLMN